MNIGIIPGEMRHRDEIIDYLTMILPTMVG